MDCKKASLRFLTTDEQKLEVPKKAKLRRTYITKELKGVAYITYQYTFQLDQIRANVKFLLYNYFRSSICNLTYYYYAYCQCLQQLSETLQGSRKHTFLVTTRVWKSYYCGKIYWSFHWNGGKDCRSLKRSDGYLFRIRNGVFFIMERCDSLKWDFNGCKLHPMIHRYDMYFRWLGQIPISLL